MHNKIESEIELFRALTYKGLSDFCNDEKYEWKTEQHFDRHVSFPVEKNKKPEKLSVKSNSSISNYVKKFIEGSLDNFSEDNIFYKYNIQLDIGLLKIYEKYKLFGRKFYLSSFDFKNGKNFLFLHLIFSLEYQNILEIYDLYLNIGGDEKNSEFGFKATINLLDEFFEKYEKRCRLIEPQMKALKNSLEKGLQEERIVENVVKKMRSEKKEYSQTTNNLLSIQLKKHKLIINKNTGDVSLSKVKTNLNPRGQEFKIISKLAISKDNIATYDDLLGDNPTKINKRNLSFAIRNIKEALGILPKRSAKNEDIIENIKMHGYRLII